MTSSNDQQSDIERLQAEFEERDRARLQLVSLIAHELAAPVTTAKGYMQLLDQGLMGEMPKNQHDIVHATLSNIARMERMVRDLSDFAQLEAGRLEMRFAAFQIHPVIYETVGMLFDQMDAEDIDLQMVVSSELPPIYADRIRVGQIITNLLSNAVKYTRQGGHVQIRAIQKDNLIQLSIQDSGVGIDEDEQERLFQPFFRSSDTFVRTQAGSGLGLVITQQLLRLQGGDIWCESVKDRGSTFHFTLPVSQG